MAGQLKKITSLILTAALLSAGMTACSENSSNAEEETKPATGTEVEAAVTEETDEEKVHDDLGEFDFAGATFGMMTFENQNFNTGTKR